MKKFWNLIRDEGGSRTLRLEGPIDEESFWGDEVTPKAFREELESDSGDITVWVNFFFFNDTATTEIYTLSLHDALPICSVGCPRGCWSCFRRCGRPPCPPDGRQ